MLAIKDEMTQIIQDQPDDSTYDEILRELAFARMIERGLKDSQTEKLLSNEEMKHRIKSWQKYSWSYRIHSETKKFERVIIPPKCKIIKNGFSTNMPSPPLNFSYGEMETMIWMADNPSTGDFIGEVRYKQESAIGLTAVSLASGAFIGALTIDFQKLNYITDFSNASTIK